MITPDTIVRSKEARPNPDSSGMMKAAVFEAPGRVTVTEVPVPAVADGDVLVRVAAAGICAGDLYIYQGKNPYARYPIIGGHEIAGVVARTGHRESDFQPGDRVVVEPFISCGHCYPCSIGKQNCCSHLSIIGVHRPGGFAEFVLAPAHRLHRVPAGLTLTHAALAEPLAVALQACRRGAISPGEIVVILGCGPIGLALVSVVAGLGAHPVAIDGNEERLDAAREAGARVIRAGGDVQDQIRRLTDREGAPVVIEATGNVKAMEQTLGLVAAGGRIVIVGLVQQGMGATFEALDFTRKEVTLVGSRASTDCFPEALRLLAGGSLRLAETIQALALDDATNVFEHLDAASSGIIKGVFVS